MAELGGVPGEASLSAPRDRRSRVSFPEPSRGSVSRVSWGGSTCGSMASFRSSIGARIGIAASARSSLGVPTGFDGYVGSVEIGDDGGDDSQPLPVDVLMPTRAPVGANRRAAPRGRRTSVAGMAALSRARAARQTPACQVAAALSAAARAVAPQAAIRDEWSPGTEDIQADPASHHIHRCSHAFDSRGRRCTAHGSIHRRSTARLSTATRDGHGASCTISAADAPTVGSMTAWLPKETLHRIQGEWALIVDEANDEVREAQRATVIPIASLGVSIRDKMPLLRLIGLRPARTIHAHIDDADVPEGGHAKLAAAVDRATSDLKSEGGARRRNGSVLRLGGPLGGAHPSSPWSSCGWVMFFAWIFNLAVLFCGLAFLLFAVLILFEEADPRWTGSIWLSFALSFFLRFVVVDVSVAALVASLPVRSRRTMTPADRCLGFLISLLDP